MLISRDFRVHVSWTGEFQSNPEGGKRILEKKKYIYLKGNAFA